MVMIGTDTRMDLIEMGLINTVLTNRDRLPKYHIIFLYQLQLNDYIAYQFSKIQEQGWPCG